MESIKFIICEDYHEISNKAAEYFANCLLENPELNVCFATGSSPIGLYKALIEKYKKGEIDFSQITAFNLDEYYPIKKSNEQSYDYFMRENLFNHINLDFKKQFILNGENENWEEECKNYDKLLDDAGGIDLQILGIGENAHIGFNEPNEELSANTHKTPLTKSTIQANARFFETEDEVPKHSLTMGMKHIVTSKKALLIATGKNKAQAIHDTFKKGITSNIPSSYLQMHRDLTVIIDKDAASMLDI